MDGRGRKDVWPGLTVDIVKKQDQRTGRGCMPLTGGTHPHVLRSIPDEAAARGYDTPLTNRVG